MKKFTLLFIACLSLSIGYTQCPGGQTEILIDVITDAYGYETYWELVPSGNGCGNGTIFAGGNNLVGCNGGGAQTQNPGGYGNNLTITEGPWCFTTGTSYDIEWVDDWGDDGLDFVVYTDGIPAYSFDGTGAGNTFTFVAQVPDPYDLATENIFTYNYVNPGTVDIRAQIVNYGSATVTDFDMNYSIDNGTAITANITGLSVAPFEKVEVLHTIPWNPTNNGTYDIKVWATNINGGNADMHTGNDEMNKSVIVGPPRANIIDQYVGATPTYTVIGNNFDQVQIPRDLEFHPTLTDNELWVINMGTEQSGGSTVTFSNTGEGNQTSWWRKDGNSWHFMNLPSGIAFSENENFATSNGIFDANHDGGTAFTGPTLWSSDPAVYAITPPGGNGSHLDMLHQSPQTQGIAHQKDNAFWVFDGYNNDIVMYDFVEDHGPGQHDHSDGIIRRYSDETVAMDPNNYVASHMVLDKNTNWLYVVDNGNDRVIRIDITTGTPGGTPTYPSFEAVAEYSTVTGYTWEEIINTGLVSPSGIALIDDRLMVSDYATGDIVIYDMANNFTELGRIQTGSVGIMGIEIAPDGRLFFVNADTDEVIRIDVGNVGVEEAVDAAILNIHPNPSKGWITINSTTDLAGYTLDVYDMTGRSVYNEGQLNGVYSRIDLSTLPKGAYSVTLQNGKQSMTQALILH